MAITAVPFFTESSVDQLDDLLMRIGVEVQLDETRHDQANTSYTAVAKFLESQSLVARLKPTIYPQGSMLLDTTVRPLIGEEFDLDFVCEYSCRTTAFAQPIDALNLIERTLKASDIYAPMVERMNRCIRLNYARQFHLDILPACKDPENGGTCILVPDRKLSQWTASNPKGFAAWFDGRARQFFVRQMLEKAAPLPIPESAHEKLPLKLCVQLLKRWRDIRFSSDPCVVISIILTALAGQVYRGEQSISLAMERILADICRLIQSSSPRLVVLNPKNADEDLSERWDANPEAYREFVVGITDFSAQWKGLSQARGIDKVTRALERLFGENLAKRVVEKQTRDIEAARADNKLGMKKGSGIVTSVLSSSVVPIPRNTFYGDEE
jgi:Second Messenger Oligonucleotide or Dinucleotide Synthetase domain